MNIEYIYLPDHYVTVTPGDPIKLFPIKSIFKNGVERTADLVRSLKLPHFKPVIKRGSHAEDAPALGYITNLFESDGWLMGETEWTPKGLAEMEEGTFRYLSPEVIWDGEMEDSSTGDWLSGPLLVGAAALHMPALGAAASFYTVETTEVDMTEHDEKVSVGALEKIKELFGAPKQEPKEQDPPAPQVDGSVEKYEAAQQEIELLQAQIAEFMAQDEKGQRVDHFAAEFKDAEAVAGDKELHELLAGIDEDVAEKLVVKFKALSAQINESNLTGAVGRNHQQDEDPQTALYSAIEELANEKEIPFHEAANMIARTRPELFEGGR